MSNRLDQLFKDKLSGHSTPAPPTGWTRVRDGLAKKNNQPATLRIAAAILLTGALVTAWMWLSDKPASPAEALTHKNDTRPIQKKIVAPQPEKVISKKKQAGVTPIINRETVVQKEAAPPAAPLSEPPTEEVFTEEALVAEPVAQAPPEKPIVLEYRLDPLPASRETEPVISSTDEKSGLSKVIDFARDAKNGDSRLGDLRQAKDELFAFGFRKGVTSK